MAWYDIGSIAVTNNSTTVTGTGTDFISGAQVGEALYINDDLYEISAIVSATQLTLADAYLGSTASGLSYKIIPTQSLVADLSSGVADLISDFADVRDYAGSGKFDDGTVSSPAITFTQDQNNGLYRIGSDNWGLVAGGEKIVDVSTNGIKLDDNNKAIFGTGSDLQIFSNGSSSYIMESGSGNLEIRATDIFLKSADNTKALATFDADGASSFSHNGSTKLATTSTGVDVTGTVTADGLTVDGASVSPLAITSTNNGAQISYSSANSNVPWYTGVSGDTSENFVIYQSGSGTAGIQLYTDGDKRLDIANNGNVSFFEDTGTTAKMVWSSSAESLGIGTASPSYALDVSQTSNAAPVGLRIRNSEGSFVLRTNGGQTLMDGDSDILFRNSSETERMRIDSSGNVAIGTEHTPNALNIYKSGGTTVNISAGSNDAGTKTRLGLGSYVSSGGGGSAIQAETYHAGTSATTLEFFTSGGEKARIDSSGNLLVGKTSTPLSVAGTSLFADGTAYHTVSANAAIRLNRLSTDGIIADFRKDGSTVGSISTVAGFPIIGKSNTGLIFDTVANGIYPQSAGGANQNGVTDLGNSSARFKDLYLSGGVYLGGTGSANKLDDYETGNWTPTFGGNAMTTVNDARYTKIGKLVYIHCDFTTPANTSTQAVYISLPFVAQSEFNGSGVIEYTTNGNANVLAMGQHGISFRGSIRGGNISFADTQASRYIFSMTYETTA